MNTTELISNATAEARTITNLHLTTPSFDAVFIVCAINQMLAANPQLKPKKPRNSTNIASDDAIRAKLDTLKVWRATATELFQVIVHRMPRPGEAAMLGNQLRRLGYKTKRSNGVNYFIITE